MEQDSDLHRRAALYYEETLRRHGATPGGVDWRDMESQEERFRQLFAVTRGASGSIAEVGCGYGALAAWMRRSGYCNSYFGCDVSGHMVAAARTAYGGLDGVEFEQGYWAANADFVVASGIFNIQFDDHDTRWRAYVERTILRMSERARYGFAFNCLTTSSDPERMESRLFYAHPPEILDWCMRRFGRHVALRHDYGLYEFTVLVWKSLSF